MRASVLSWLYYDPRKSYYVRQLEKILGYDSTNLSRELARLEEAGLVKSRIEGRQKYFQADASCPVFEELRNLFLQAADPRSVIGEALRPVKSSVKVAFMSGKDPAEVDMTALRLFIIGSCSEKDASRAAARAGTRLKREIEVSVYTPRRWSDLYISGNASVRRAAAGKKVFVAGDEEILASIPVRRRMTDAIESWMGEQRQIRHRSPF